MSRSGRSRAGASSDVRRTGHDGVAPLLHTEDLCLVVAQRAQGRPLLQIPNFEGGVVRAGHQNASNHVQASYGARVPGGVGTGPQHPVPRCGNWGGSRVSCPRRRGPVGATVALATIPKECAEAGAGLHAP